MKILIFQPFLDTFLSVKCLKMVKKCFFQYRQVIKKKKVLSCVKKIYIYVYGMSHKVTWQNTKNTFVQKGWIHGQSHHIWHIVALSLPTSQAGIQDRRYQHGPILVNISEYILYKLVFHRAYISEPLFFFVLLTKLTMTYTA